MSEYLIEQNIQKVLKNGPENKNQPSFERGDLIEFKYFIRNEF